MRAARVMDLDAVDRSIGKLGGDFAGKVVIIASTPRRDKPTSASRPLLERKCNKSLVYHEPIDPKYNRESSRPGPEDER